MNIDLTYSHSVIMSHCVQCLFPWYFFSLILCYNIHSAYTWENGTLWNVSKSSVQFLRLLAAANSGLITSLTLQSCNKYTWLLWSQKNSPMIQDY